MSTTPMNVPQHIRNVLSTLHSAGEQAYIVGGAVRDHLLGLIPKDFDITTSTSPERVAALFGRVLLVGAEFGVAVIVTSEENVEVAQFRAETDYDGRRPGSVVLVDNPREDVIRRDFTVNGLLYDISTDQVIDHVGGVDDLQAKRLRTIGDPMERFTEDRLRMLRAVRFAITKGFIMDQSTVNAIRDHSKMLSECDDDGKQIVSAERISSELEKILTHKDRQHGYHMLTYLGLMDEILPEVLDLKGVEQPPKWHPEGDVYIHTGLVLNALRQPSFAQALAALLHDIGKPATQKIDPDTGRISFHGHETVGAEMAEKICQRLKTSSQVRKDVVWIVENHMRFHKLGVMRASKCSVLFDHPLFLGLAEQGRADCRGTLDQDDREYNLAIEMYEAYQNDSSPAGPLRNGPFIRGNEIIELGVPKGPLIGMILGEIDDARREGELADKNEALALAEGLVGELRKAGRM